MLYLYPCFTRENTGERYYLMSEMPVETTNAPAPEETKIDKLFRLTSFGKRHGGRSGAITTLVLIEVIALTFGAILAVRLGDSNVEFVTKGKIVFLAISPFFLVQIISHFVFFRFWSAILILTLFVVGVGCFGGLVWLMAS